MFLRGTSGRFVVCSSVMEWITFLVGGVTGAVVMRFVIDARWIRRMQRESDERRERWEARMAEHGKRSNNPPESP